jgi:hypothetical protein
MHFEVNMIIDLREGRYGYSTHIKHDSPDLRISLGKEANYEHNRFIATVELKELGIEVIGYENLYDRAERFLNKKTTADDFLCEVLGLINFNYTRLIHMVKNSYEAGKAVGAAEVRSQLRELIGV